MKQILATLFPKQITNTFPGQKIALITFVPLTLIMLALSLIPSNPTRNGNRT